MPVEGLAAPIPTGPVGPISIELIPRGPEGSLGLEATFPREFLSPNPFGDMPFSSSERLMAIPEQHHPRLAVAAHELNHVLTARSLGYEVLDVTAKPGKGYLGLTTFAGSVSPEAFRLIAAAGAVATPYGSAEGYWNDLFQVNQINTETGGTIGGAISGAEGHVTSHPERVRKKMAEIIVYMETHGWPLIPGFMIDEIKARAEMEITFEDMGENASLFAVITSVPDREELLREYLFKKQHYTQLVDIGDGNGILIEVEGDIIIRETRICTFCGGENGEHSKVCQLKVQQTGEEMSEPMKQDTAGSKLPEKIVIYTYSSAKPALAFSKSEVVFSVN